MLLVVDVGNTNIVIGLMEGEQPKHTFRLTTTPRTTDEFGLALTQLLAARGLSAEPVSGAIISSVVPTLLYSLEKAVRRYFEVEPLVVGRKLKTGMKVRTDNPREVGADRIVNAVAAAQLWGGPVIVVDFGTATTIDCVNRGNEYVGGAIAPGLRIAEEALFSHTAQLPRIDLQRPKTAIGTNTVHAMQSGLFFGYTGLVDALVRRCREELDTGTVKVVATGGLATLIAAESKEIQLVEPHLTLKGLAMLYARNAPGGED